MFKPVPYLHPGLVAVFFLLFTVMAVVGMLRLIKDRQVFGSLLLLMATIIFGYSTYVAATI
jgi:Protein of unknown function (DUF2759)